MMDLLLHNLRTIGTHHCDQTVGEEAAAEIEALRAALKLKMKTAGDEYAHRLAVMLECALLDRRGTWDAAHALLDEYRAACRAVDERLSTRRDEVEMDEMERMMMNALETYEKQQGRDLDMAEVHVFRTAYAMGVQDQQSAMAVMTANMRDAMRPALDLLKEYMDSVGGCDHSVGICQCGEYVVFENAAKATGWMTPNAELCGERSESERAPS